MVDVLRARRRAYVPQRSVYQIDTVSTLDIGTTLMLLAEFDRIATTNVGPHELVDERWKPDLRNMLRSLGFYHHLMGASIEETRPVHLSDGVICLPFARGERVDQALIERLVEDLGNICVLAPSVRNLIADAICEAVENAVGHGYKAHWNELLTCRWWCAVGWHEPSRSVRFAVFDQGVGIPSRLAHTHPQWLRSAFPSGASDMQRLVGFVRDRPPAEHRPERGTGFETMFGQGWRNSDDVKASSFYIASGAALIEVADDHQLAGYTLPVELGGTLAQWCIELREEACR